MLLTCPKLVSGNAVAKILCPMKIIWNEIWVCRYIGVCIHACTCSGLFLDPSFYQISLCLIISKALCDNKNNHFYRSRYPRWPRWSVFRYRFSFNTGGNSGASRDQDGVLHFRFDEDATLNDLAATKKGAVHNNSNNSNYDNCKYLSQQLDRY